MGEYGPRFDIFRFNAIQLAAVAIPCIVLMPFTGGLPSTGEPYWVAFYAGVVVSALALIPWTWAQRHIPATRASLILLTEPVFATVAAYLVDDERFTARRGARRRPHPRRRRDGRARTCLDRAVRARFGPTTGRTHARGLTTMADPNKPRAPFAPWDRREIPGAFDVEDSARRVGNYKWIEMKLFEALGGWVATVPELDVKMRLGTHCYHHAWHAELWHKRLPELREMNPDRLTVPANDELVAFVDAMTEPEAPEPHDREARRRLPGADPPQDRGVHVPPQQHLDDHRRADDPVAQVRPARRVRGLARRRDAHPVAHRDR